jgi:hypothetical protein
MTCVMCNPRKRTFTLASLVPLTMISPWRKILFEEFSFTEIVKFHSNRLNSHCAHSFSFLQVFYLNEWFWWLQNFLLFPQIVSLQSLLIPNFCLLLFRLRVWIWSYKRLEHIGICNNQLSLHCFLWLYTCLATHDIFKNQQTFPHKDCLFR